LPGRILDSRGNPTVDGSNSDSTTAPSPAAPVPSGASTGAFEALELRDGDGKRYGGKGVETAVANIADRIVEELVGLRGERPARHRPEDARPRRHAGQVQPRRERHPGRVAGGGEGGRASAELSLFRYLGGPNAHLLPVPMMNILNGGAHADSNVDIQEFMIAPIGAPTFREALRTGAEVYHALKSVLKKKGLSTGLGDEGGFAPNLPANVAALDLIAEAVQAAGYTSAPTSCSPSTWPPPSSRQDGAYTFEGAPKSSDDMIAYYRGLVGRLPDRVHRGPAGRGRLGRLEGADRGVGRTGSRSSATTCSSPTRSASPGASPSGPPTRCWSR
jgi:enolase